MKLGYNIQFNYELFLWRGSVALANEMIPSPNSTLEVLISKFAAQSGTDNYQLHQSQLN